MITATISVRDSAAIISPPRAVSEENTWEILGEILGEKCVGDEYEAALAVATLEQGGNIRSTVF